MLSFALAILTAMAAVSPSPPPDPCAHRAFCGPIRLVPADPVQRRSFYANVAASIVDGIVTSHFAHGDPANEANPVVRPFVRNGLPSLVLGWGLMEIGQRSVARTFHLNEARVDDFTLSQHIAGVASWLSPVTYAWGTPPKLIYGNSYIQQRWIIYDVAPSMR
jgi:hypothetical protein